MGLKLKQRARIVCDAMGPRRRGEPENIWGCTCDAEFTLSINTTEFELMALTHFQAEGWFIDVVNDVHRCPRHFDGWLTEEDEEELDDGR